MPVTKSAERGMRVSARRQARNKTVISRCKTRITTAENKIQSKDSAAKESVVDAIKSLDKAAECGMLHPNNTARRKSRLMKKLNKASAPETKK